jgi:hypothetical protein
MKGVKIGLALAVFIFLAMGAIKAIHYYQNRYQAQTVYWQATQAPEQTYLTDDSGELILDSKGQKETVYDYGTITVQPQKGDDYQIDLLWRNDKPLKAGKWYQIQASKTIVIEDPVPVAQAALPDHIK